MRKYFIIFIMSLVLFGCDNTKTQNDFINTDCNIPIIECVIGNDTVDMIVDSGAEYSLINSEYYKQHISDFKVVNQVETQFSGIGGVNIQISRIVATNSSLGYITFVEQNLKAVVESLPQYEIAGLIGSDFLKSRYYIIDYKMRKIYPYQLIDSIYKYGN